MQPFKGGIKETKVQMKRRVWFTSDKNWKLLQVSSTLSSHSEWTKNKSAYLPVEQVNIESRWHRYSLLQELWKNYFLIVWPSGVDGLPCFIMFLSLIFLILLFVITYFIAGESPHTSSKERKVPESLITRLNMCPNYQWYCLSRDWGNFSAYCQICRL